MLELARHIIEKKQGAFDPIGFPDRYEKALADLVKPRRARARAGRLRNPLRRAAKRADA